VLEAKKGASPMLRKSKQRNFVLKHDISHLSRIAVIIYETIAFVGRTAHSSDIGVMVYFWLKYKFKNMLFSRNRLSSRIKLSSRNRLFWINGGSYMEPSDFV
jgi:hypothetical protein